MTTIKIHAPVYWNHKTAIQKEKSYVWDSLATFSHRQVKNDVPMFKNLVIAQCVLFIPLLAILMFGFHIQVGLLAVIIGLFLINIMIEMGGSGMRTINGIFALGILNLLMLAMLLV